MNEVTNINNRRKEFIVNNLSSINGDLKVDEKTKSDRKWFQYLGIQYIHFVKETTEKIDLNRHLNTNLQKSVSKL